MELNLYLFPYICSSICNNSFWLTRLTFYIVQANTMFFPYCASKLAVIYSHCIFFSAKLLCKKCIWYSEKKRRDKFFFCIFLEGADAVNVPKRPTDRHEEHPQYAECAESMPPMKPLESIPRPRKQRRRVNTEPSQDEIHCSR